MGETQEKQAWFLGRKDYPGEGNSNSVQYFCLKNSMDRGVWLQSLGSKRVCHNLVIKHAHSRGIITSSLTSDLIHTACIGNLNHWTAREVPRNPVCLSIELVKQVGNGEKWSWRVAGFRFSSVTQSSYSVVSDSLRTHGLQHARLLCPSPSPGVCSDSCSYISSLVTEGDAPFSEIIFICLYCSFI